MLSAQTRKRIVNHDQLISELDSLLHSQLASPAVETGSTGSFYRSLLESLGAAVVMVDTDWRVTYRNAYAERLRCLLLDDLTPDPDCDSLAAEQQDRIVSHYNRVIASGRPGRFEHWAVDQNKRERLIAWSTSPLFNGGGAISHLVSVGIDVTDSRSAEDKLKAQATTDGLTGAYNRHHFSHLAGQAFVHARRYHRPLTVMMVDADHFKRVNDGHGHGTGDRVLKLLAGICHDTLRRVDILGRYGGEEFIVVLPETPLEPAAESAERLRRAIETSSVEAPDGSPVTVTVSIGLAELQEADRSLESLMQRADEALYRAKEQGRNRVERDA